jgi:hypothetical protein
MTPARRCRATCLPISSKAARFARVSSKLRSLAEDEVVAEGSVARQQVKDDFLPLELTLAQLPQSVRARRVSRTALLVVRRTLVERCA